MDDDVRHHGQFEEPAKLAALPDAVGWARRHTEDVLPKWDIPPDSVETAALLVSELATNAVRHTGVQESRLSFAALAGVRTMILVLRFAHGHLLVEVDDEDRTPPTARHVGEDSESGRGLFLVEAMSSGWGYYHPTPHAGKVVWAEVPLLTQDAMAEAACKSDRAERRR